MMNIRPYYLLDTNVISEPTKNIQNANVIKNLMKYAAVSAVSSISFAEMCKGIQKLPSGSERQIDLLNYFTNEVSVLYSELVFDRHAAIVYGDIFETLRERGTPKSEMDLLIAATAIANNMILVTRNVKDFEDIPGLMLENWFE